MSKVVETTVPISIENLKLYFEDKEITFLIDYDNSSLREDKILTYLSNLELPCDIKFDNTNQSHLLLLKEYFLARSIVNIPALAEAALEVCIEYKNREVFGYAQFIKDNTETIKKWVNLLESLSLYNLYTIDSPTLKEYVTSFKTEDCSVIGLNFVNLLKYEYLGLIYENTKEEDLSYYPDFFNEYIFKGNSLYHYWQHENNPMFIMTLGILDTNIGQQLQGEPS